MDDVILFHGSRGGIQGDIQPKSRPRCDFGYGFYMGTMVLTEEQYNYAIMQGRKEEKINVLQKLIDAGCIKRKDIEKVFKGEKIEGINFSNNISR